MEQRSFRPDRDATLPTFVEGDVVFLPPFRPVQELQLLQRSCDILQQIGRLLIGTLVEVPALAVLLPRFLGSVRAHVRHGVFGGWDRLLRVEIQPVVVLEELKLDHRDVDRPVAEPAKNDIQPLTDGFADEDDSLVLVERVVLVAELVEYLGERLLVSVERFPPRRGFELLELVTKFGVIPVRGVGGVFESLKIDFRFQRASFEFDGDDVGISIDGKEVDSVSDLLDRDFSTDEPKILTENALRTVDDPLTEIVLPKPLLFERDGFQCRNLLFGTDSEHNTEIVSQGQDSLLDGW